MNRLALHLALLAVLVVGCAPTGNAGSVSNPNGDQGGTWSYAKGPHGENCLLFSGGAGYSQFVAMSCDSVKP